MTMRVPVFDLRGKSAKSTSLPSAFETPIRPDLIKRVVVALQTHRLQPQGRDPRAGKRTTAESLGAGYGVARIPRVKGERYPAARRGAFAVGTVGGRRAHPPVSVKKISKRVNRKERRLAIRSAISATAVKDVVKKRGHVVDKVPAFPLVVVDRFEKYDRTTRIKRVLTRLGLWPDIERAKARKKIRSGKGKMRGRRYKKAKGPLIIVSDDSRVGRAARNLPGVDVVAVRNLNAELLAPGAHPGRLVLWTESALRQLNGLFS